MARYGTLLRTGLGLVVLAALLGLHAEARAWDWMDRHCKKPCCHNRICPTILNCECFGYYPTCWRPWPGGCTRCPTPAVPGTPALVFEKAPAASLNPPQVSPATPDREK